MSSSIHPSDLKMFLVIRNEYEEKKEIYVSLHLRRTGKQLTSALQFFSYLNYLS